MKIKILPLRIVLPSRDKVKIRKGNGLMPTRIHKQHRIDKRNHWKQIVEEDLTDLT